jgi:hypothetical protein
VSLPEDARLWFEVQAETLKRVHSSWLPGVPIEMLTQARKLALGRRWLAKRLYRVSPVLFGPPPQFDSATLEQLRAAAWLAPLVADPFECALDLGSLAMAATIRTLVNRPEGVKIRGALGPERYARVLAFRAAPSESAPATAAGDLDMVERLVRCGAAEFAGFGDHLHPVWGESVRLTYECSWWIDACAPSLTAAAAQACLRLRIQHGEDRVAPLSRSPAGPQAAAAAERHRRQSPGPTGAGQ